MTITLKDEKFEFYDSIEDLPQKQFLNFEKMLLIESGVGENLQAFDVHLQKIFLFMSNNKNQEAKEEILNLRQNFFFMISNFSVKTLALCCLLKGKEIINQEQARTTSKELIEKGITNNQIESLIEQVKKKYIPN